MADEMTATLITGGAGFIGTNFIYHWHALHAEDRLVVLDDLTYAGNLGNLLPLLRANEIEFIKGNICNEALLAELFTKHKFSRVVHFAAESHVDRSIVGPDIFVKTNVNGTLALLKAALTEWRENGSFRQFHHVSTDEVYGSLGPDDAPFLETTPYSPRSPYAASKAASDHLVRAYGHTYGLPITISNCSNNYGPFHFPEKLIPLMIVNLLEGRQLPIYGDGENVRDWLYVEDHCAAIAAILERGRIGETYNIGGRSEISNLELVHRLCEIMDEFFCSDSGLKSLFPHCPVSRGGRCANLITFVKDRPGHDRRYAIDCGKLEIELNVRPQVDLTAGLERTVDWFLKNEVWWRSIMSGEYHNWIRSHYGTAELTK
jgi:dTDP-glucose 4,6-dehydratase